MDRITDYINLCEDNIIPNRTVHCFPTTSDLKDLLAIRSGVKDELKRIQRDGESEAV